MVYNTNAKRAIRNKIKYFNSPVFVLDVVCDTRIGVLGTT